MSLYFVFAWLVILIKCYGKLGKGVVDHARRMAEKRSSSSNEDQTYAPQDSSASQEGRRKPSSNRAAPAAESYLNLQQSPEIQELLQQQQYVSRVFAPFLTELSTVACFVCPAQKAAGGRRYGI